MPISFANQVVNRCLRITEKDNVTISVSSHVIPLAEDIAAQCFKNGADVLLNLYTDKYHNAYLSELSVESLKQGSVFCRALTENSTAEIWLLGAHDPSIFKKIPAEKLVADGEGEMKSHYPLAKEKKVRSLGLGVALVTRPRAKTYGFNYNEWKRMMYAASSVDHEKLAHIGGELEGALSNTRAIRITHPNGTNLEFDVSGRRWQISDGVIDETDIQKENFDDTIPAGSVSVIPLKESARGTVNFNVATPDAGIAVGRLGWTFKDGRVTEFSGDSSTRRLKQQWEQASGDKDKISYFAVGFNPKARAGYTVNTIAAGTVSVGIGGNEHLGGMNKSGFFFVSTLSGATVQADGNIILKAGKFQLRQT